MTTDPTGIARDRGRPRALALLRLVAAATAHVCDWAAAAEGRRRTEDVLRGLDPAAWHLVDLAGLPGGGHVDHVLIGRAGIYVLDSEAWRGVVTVDQKGATITPDSDPDAAWTARGRHRSLAPAAAAVVHELSAVTGNWMPPPRAVVVVWAPFPETVAISGGVTYVAGPHLAAWLGTQPRRLDRDHLDGFRRGTPTAGPLRLRESRDREPV